MPALHTPEEFFMLYRFKSRATGDLVMLEAAGRRVIEILGKDPAGPGIITQAQLPAAVEALQEAVRADQARDEALPEVADRVTLRMRTAPFIEMLQHAMQAGVDVVWGV
jgi:hypothetical protein